MISTQTTTKSIEQGTQCILDLLDRNLVDEVACEDYRVYAWESDTHKWAELHTAKLVGAIIAICYMREIPCTLRMAQVAKKFITDEKLKAWGIYDKGKRHSRDATRHAIYHLLFKK